MAKYKVLQRFRDIKTGEVYEPDQEIEFTEKRGSDVIKKLEEYGGGFLEEIGPTAEEIELQEKEAAESEAKAKAEKEVAEKKKADKKSEKDEK